MYLLSAKAELEWWLAWLKQLEAVSTRAVSLLMN
jgi:hypothetical protein